MVILEGFDLKTLLQIGPCTVYPPLANLTLAFVCNSFFVILHHLNLPTHLNSIISDSFLKRLQISEFHCNLQSRIPKSSNFIMLWKSWSQTTPTFIICTYWAVKVFTSITLVVIIHIPTSSFIHRRDIQTVI